MLQINLEYQRVKSHRSTLQQVNYFFMISPQIYVANTSVEELSVYTDHSTDDHINYDG